MSQVCEPDYAYVFEGITDRLDDSHLHITDRRSGLSYTIKVAVNDTAFLHKRDRLLPSVIADLIDLAVSIYEADRWSIRRKDAPCNIRVRLPLRHPELHSDSEMKQLLERLLFWYTGDAWSFDFTAFDRQRRLSESQRLLWAAPPHETPVEVALWSGGLDSFAGLCNRIARDSAQKYLLFGAGGNSGIQGIQQQIADSVRPRFPGRDISLTQVSIRQLLPKRLPHDKHLRARGLVFMLLGAAYALLEGQNSLVVYENGIGAINLPFRSSEVGLDHARAVHPLSLQYLSDYVSRIMERKFNIQNPFLFWTKAEMCRVLKGISVDDLVWSTTSCDRRYRKRTKECGRCSSCLLRRQALAAAGIRDRTGYLVETETGKSQYRLLTTSHLPAMLFQLDRLRGHLNQPDTWNILAREHPSLMADLVVRVSAATGLVRGELANQIVALFQRYVDEWAIDDVKSLFDMELASIFRATMSVGAQPTNS